MGYSNFKNVSSLKNSFKENKTNGIFFSFSIIIYLVLVIFCLNNCYFWDTIQQISREAHWFYLNDFKSLIITDYSGEIKATGYHPPLMGILTAGLWKIFGYKLWVSHLFTFFWFTILIYNLYKLILNFVNSKYSGIILLIILLDVTLISQFSISSPDFILLTAFIVSARAILEKKNITLMIGLIFLSCINIRGLFATVILFISNVFYDYYINDKQYSFKKFAKLVYPYLPAIALLSAYYIYYFITIGWFFNNSAYSEHYILPDSLSYLIKHIVTFFMRLTEDGRFVVWLLFLYLFIRIIKTKSKLSIQIKFLLINIILLYALYFIFVFTSKMPFSPRYFLPQFILLTLLTLILSIKFFNVKRLKIIFAVIILAQLTGHFWIYNERISQPWDCRLSHLPYYDLREECFNYIETNNIEYKDVSGGFCFSGNRLYYDLDNNGKIIGKSTSNKYYIHSNVSNNEDNILDEIKDPTKWTEIKTFKKWPIYVKLYKNLDYE